MPQAYWLDAWATPTRCLHPAGDTVKLWGMHVSEPVAALNLLDALASNGKLGIQPLALGSIHRVDSRLFDKDQAVHCVDE